MLFLRYGASAVGHLPEGALQHRDNAQIMRLSYSFGKFAIAFWLYSRGLIWLPSFRSLSLSFSLSLSPHCAYFALQTIEYLKMKGARGKTIELARSLMGNNARRREVQALR